MNEAQRRAEMQRLVQSCQQQAAACRNALERMRAALPADQDVAVDIGRIEQIFGAHGPAAAEPFHLPCFAMRG